MIQQEALADAFLAAAVEPERWLGALGQLAAATRSDHAQLIGIGPRYALGFNWVSHMAEAVHTAFDSAELITPKRNFRVAAGAGQAAGMMWEDHYDAIRPQLEDDAYVELCEEAGIPFGCQTNLRADADGIVGFALLRSRRSGRTGEDERAFFARARHGAHAAIALQVALEREGHRLVAGGFDAMGIAGFVLDRRMSVHGVTGHAQALLSQGVIGLSEGRVTLPHAADDRRLAIALQKLARLEASGAGIAVADGDGMMALTLHRLPLREWNMGFAPFAILVVKRNGAANPGDLAFLRDAFGLTVSEAEIALLLRAGHARSVICAARGIGQETLRSHLRAIFAKLGVSRETEAIHRLHTLIG